MRRKRDTGDLPKQKALRSKANLTLIVQPFSILILKVTIVHVLNIIKLFLKGIGKSNTKVLINKAK